MSGFWRVDVEVWDSGYEWGWPDSVWAKYKDKDPPGNELVLEIADGPPFDSRRYDPLTENTALFWLFGRLKPTPPAIQAFANKYGLIGVNDDPFPSLKVWRKAIRDFRFALDLWAAIQSEDVEAVVKEYEKLYPGLLVPPPFISYRQPQPEKDPIGFATKELHMWVAAPCEVTATVSPMTTPTGSALSVQVDDLLTALRIQLALAVFEDRSYRECEACGEHFELSPDLNRADRTTCSSPCRQKAYRRRQKRARTMRAEGAHLRTIAKSLGSDTRIVKRWLGEN